MNVSRLYSSNLRRAPLSLISLACGGCPDHQLVGMMIKDASQLSRECIYPYILDAVARAESCKALQVTRQVSHCNLRLECWHDTAFWKLKCPSQQPTIPSSAGKTACGECSLLACSLIAGLLHCSQLSQFHPAPLSLLSHTPSMIQRLGCSPTTYGRPGRKAAGSSMMSERSWYFAACSSEKRVSARAHRGVGRSRGMASDRPCVCTSCYHEWQA